MFFKSKISRNKLYIFPEVEVHIAEQNPAGLIELGFLVLESSLLLLKKINNRSYKKGMQFWK